MNNMSEKQKQSMADKLKAWKAVHKMRRSTVSDQGKTNSEHIDDDEIKKKGKLFGTLTPNSNQSQNVFRNFSSKTTSSSVKAFNLSKRTPIALHEQQQQQNVNPNIESPSSKELQRPQAGRFTPVNSPPTSDTSCSRGSSHESADDSGISSLECLCSPINTKDNCIRNSLGSEYSDLDSDEIDEDDDATVIKQRQQIRAFSITAIYL